jgi:glycine/D-amino acid oxidase-like deaminating enzyme
VTEAPLWTAPFDSGPVSEAAPIPSRTGVAVVGAGYTGLSAALALAKRERSVVVLEAECIGFGASSRNGGMVLTGLKLGPDALLRRYGTERARALFAASLSAIELLEHLIESEHIECDYANTGHVELAATSRHASGFGALQSALQAEFGHSTRVLDGDALRDEIGSTAFHGGLLDERSGALDPYRYVLGLAQAARSAGATVVENARVRLVDRAGSAWKVTTTRGELLCDQLVVATGAYTGSEFPRLQRRFVPLGSYVIATEPLGEALARELIPKNRMLFDSKRLLHYFRVTPDQRLLFGGRAAFVPANASTTRRSAEILRRDMVGIFPQVRDIKIAYAWGGTLDVTFDFLPHAGSVGGLYYAIGHAGHGVALATLLGTLIAAAIAEGRAPAPFERVLPQAPLGLYNGRPWFLPLVGAWQRVADTMA